MNAKINNREKEIGGEGAGRYFLKKRIAHVFEKKKVRV